MASFVDSVNMIGTVLASFDHVILTRFSVRFVADQLPPTNEWLQFRWAFFRDACASSLANQTSDRFTWLVFFDESSPQWLREEVAEQARGLFRPVWLDETWSLAAVQRAVESLATAEYLITTRLDSDDAVARDFVADIQSAFDEQGALYVNFLNGVQVSRTGEVFRYRAPSNAFISFIERREPGQSPRTVFQHPQHGRSREHAPLLNLVGPPRWMQVVHDANLMNSVRGTRLRPEVVNGEFELDLPYTREVGRSQLLREYARSLGRLWGTWLRQPWLFRQYASAAMLQTRGTRLLNQKHPTNLSRADEH